MGVCPMTDLEKLLAEVTPGEWRNSGPATASVNTFHVRSDNGLRASVYGRNARAEADLIAMAPALARKVIAAEKLVEALRLVMQHGTIMDSEMRMNACGSALSAWEAAQ